MVIDGELILLLILLLLCTIGISWFAGTDAPFVPTTSPDLIKALKAAKVKKSTHFYELGSGDGRVVIEAAKLGSTAIGIEQSWLRVWYSRFQARGLKHVHYYHGSIYDRAYFPADVVYIFLLQKAVDKLEAKLKKELKKGAIVVTQTYHFKNWKPFKKIGNFCLYKA